eukprot:Pompholyxophrys_punicea_v1_NODE_1298_length_804_cov_3.252336.p1 type:complete len:193 gc:universal NODE_1298_length_804_cov_3.252336:681-103(-)
MAVEEFTVVIVGGGGVGKSCLTVRFLKDEFTSEYDPTIEENYRKKISLSDYECILDVVDTAGQQEYASLRDQHLRTGQGFLLVYAINDEASLSEAKELYEAIIMVKDSGEKVPFVVVGNKCDLKESERKVKTSEGKAFADSLKSPFFETSALANINVDAAFHALVGECRVKLGAQAKAQEKTKKKKTLFGKK